MRRLLARQNLAMAKLRRNDRRLRGLLSTAFNRTAREVRDETRANTEAGIWAWPGATQRKNGQVVGSPRNVVDLGEFRDKQRLTIQSFVAKLIFFAPHAPHVIFGFTTRSGNDFPGRNPFPRKERLCELWRDNVRRVGGGR